MTQLNMATVNSRWVARGIGRNIADRHYEARIVNDPATRRDAYELRYRSYLSQGHIGPNESGLFSDRYDELPTATSVIVYANGNPAGSVRVCRLRRGEGTTSPARDNYPAEVGALLDESGPPGPGYDGIEVNRLVRAPEAEDDQGLVFMLLRLAGHLGLVSGFNVVFSCVRAHHLPFYRRMRFKEAGEFKTYPGLNCPMVLLKLSRTDWNLTREGFRLMDPEAGPAGLLQGLELGKTVCPHLVRRA